MNIAKPETYSEDGRISISSLQEKYQKLVDLGWQSETITMQKGYPIVAYTTPLKNNRPTKSLWILGGIHGEEPAGPNAFSTQIETINGLAKEGIPVVFIPLLNPYGYSKDWRYENEKRDFHLGQSVTDFSSIKGETNTHVVNFIKKTATVYLPELVFDHHEDRVAEIYPEGDPRNISSCYVYVYGSNPIAKEISQSVNQIFKNSGLPIVEKGLTRFGEKITDGFVMSNQDGSVDEYLASLSASVVIVIETTIPYDSSIPLKKRQIAHQEIIKQYSNYWKRIK